MPYKTYHLSCDCGLVAVQIQVQQHLLACCYCADCQRYARYLSAQKPVINADGGTSVMIINPHQLQILQGQAQLGFLSLSKHGSWRCYATCCRTPILNMSANSKALHLALFTYGLSSTFHDAVQQHPVLKVRKPEQKLSVNRCVTWLRFAYAYAYTLIVAWCKKSHLHNPLIDQARRQPIRNIEVINADTL